ncbi:hypothetical protein KCU99_g101, partial [Aureobasidium melanogenum]
MSSELCLVLLLGMTISHEWSELLSLLISEKNKTASTWIITALVPFATGTFFFLTGRFFLTPILSGASLIQRQIASALSVEIGYSLPSSCAQRLWTGARLPFTSCKGPLKPSSSSIALRSRARTAFWKVSSSTTRSSPIASTIASRFLRSCFCSSVSHLALLVAEKPEELAGIELARVLTTQSSCWHVAKPQSNQLLLENERLGRWGSHLRDARDEQHCGRVLEAQLEGGFSANRAEAG